ncbi:hydroxypyruvate isomerase, partial [Brucella sp. 21LCYQ03]|nr:hydroxypyruvate isomerase [Brucella sp. 21LCYQ03]
DNPGRNEPTTGEINYLNIFKWLNTKGYQDIVGMEHGISESGKAGEERLLKAYRAVDSFN